MTAKELLAFTNSSTFSNLKSVWILMTTLFLFFGLFPVFETIYFLLLFTQQYVIVIAIWLVVPTLCAYSLAARRTKLTARHAILNVACIALCLNTLFALRPESEFFLFHLEKPFYRQAIAEVRRSGCLIPRRFTDEVFRAWCEPEPDLSVGFLWDGFLTDWRGVLFDPDHTIVKTANAEGSFWLAFFRPYDGSGACFSVEKNLGDGFYVVSVMYTDDGSPESCH